MARTQGHGNPKWTRDEVILALDLYFELGGNVHHSRNPRVQDLSRQLRGLPYHKAAAKKTTFRNPPGVAFKLQNLRQVATGKGLGNVSQIDVQVWKELGDKPAEVKRLATLIRQGVHQLSEWEDDEEQSDEEPEFAEGRLLTLIHRRKERAKALRPKLLKGRRRQGPLACDICGCRSPSTDPTLEDAPFEAHHTVPIGGAGERKTRISDLALLCANCHRLLHRLIARARRWLNIEEARELLRLNPSS